MLIRGKYLLSGPDYDQAAVQNQAVLVQGDKITAIGSYEQLVQDHPQETVLGDGSQLVMPGLIDSHTHGAGLSFAQRGVPYDFLENALLGFECARDISPELNSTLNAVRHIRNGCTTIHHNNWSRPLAPNELSDCRRKIRAYQQTGIRLGFSLGIRNKNIVAYDEDHFIQTLPSDLAEQVKYLTEYDKDAAIDAYMTTFETLHQEYDRARTRIFFGPNWVQGSTDRFLRKVKERADELGKIPIHLHTLQTPVQKAFGLREYGKSLVEHLNDLGLVDENLVLGHAVYLTQKDIGLLAAKNSSVTHHPSCNLVMRNGIAPVNAMLEAGLNVALGIDEKGINDDEDPFMELRVMYYLHRANGLDLCTPALSAGQIFKTGLGNASRVCGFGSDLGILAPGKAADILLVDLKEIISEPWSNPDFPLQHQLIHRALGRHVNTVVIGGQIVMKDRQMLTVDLESLYREAAKAARRGQTAEQKKYAKVMQKIKPYYQAWYNNWLEQLELDPYTIMNSRI